LNCGIFLPDVRWLAIDDVGVLKLFGLVDRTTNGVNGTIALSPDGVGVLEFLSTQDRFAHSTPKLT